MLFSGILRFYADYLESIIKFEIHWIGQLIE